MSLERGTQTLGVLAQLVQSLSPALFQDEGVMETKGQPQKYPARLAFLATDMAFIPQIFTAGGEKGT